MRSTFINTLVKSAENDDRIVLITPDLGFSVLEEFAHRFPDRFINIGIAESNAVGVASGLALSGKIVYVYSIIPFVTMRPFEQIRVDVAYMNLNVRLVGVGAGLSYGPAGATHHAIEDISVMRSLPNMTVISPCDPWEVEQCIIDSTRHQGPMYIRLAKNGEPVVNKSESSFTIGKANILSKSNEGDILILFTGNACDIAIQTAEILNQTGKKSTLASIHSIKPFDSLFLNDALKSMKYIFTIEEHSLIGGLGSTVAEIIAESKYNPVFKKFSLPDSFTHIVGNANFLRNKLGLTSERISQQILEIINE